MIFILCIKQSLSLGILISFHYLVLYLCIHVSVKCVYCCLDCCYLLSLLVRNVKTEILFHSNHKLYWIEWVKTKLLESSWSTEFRMIAFSSWLEYLIDFGLNFFKYGSLCGIWAGSKEVSWSMTKIVIIFEEKCRYSSLVVISKCSGKCFGYNRQHH